MASGFKLEARDDGAGLLHIALADAAPISGAGALAILHLHLASNAQRGDVSSLVLSEIQLNDIAGRDLQTSALQQTIVPTDGRVSIAEYSTYLPIIMRP